MNQKVEIVANITSPQPFKVQFSTSVENTLYGPSIEGMIGIPGFLALPLICNVEHSFQPIQELKALVKGVSFKQPMATSSRCHGSLIQEATSNLTNSMPFSTMTPKWSGNGVTIASLSRSMIVVGKLKLLDQFRRVSETVSGHRL